MQKYQVALIGTGAIAKNHVDALLSESARVTLVAAVDTNPDALAAFCDAHAVPNRYTDATTMLHTEQPDLVLICTPPAIHADLCIEAMHAGAHVLCEKPVVASLAELARVQVAEHATGKTCSSAFQWRFGSAGLHVRKLLGEGAFGRPLLAACHTTWYRDRAYYAVPWRGKWATELGGVTLTHGIHAMDFLLWLLGDWAEVNALTATLDHDIEVDDVSMVHVKFANGTLASVVNSVVSPRQESYIRLDCQRATVELRHLYGYDNSHWRFTQVEGAAATAASDTWQQFPADAPGTHPALLTATLDALFNGETPPTAGASLWNTTEFLTALYKSAHLRTPVRRGEITPEDPFYHDVHPAVAG